MDTGYTDAEAVIREATLTAQPAINRLTAAERWLHQRGYREYSAVLGQMRLDIEAALERVVRELRDAEAEA